MVSFWPLVKFRFHKKEELYLSLHALLGFKPHDIDLYKLALIHKSVSVRDQEGKMVNNERLEFLGDAVLEAVMSDLVFRRFSKAREGFLTTTRSKLVQRSSLNRLSSQIGLNNMVHYSLHTESHNSDIGGNAFEALIGAIYLDRGYKRSVWFINRLIRHGYINPEGIAKKEENFKSLLLEWCQKYKFQIEFHTVEEENTMFQQPVFFSSILVEGNKLGCGEGYSKKESHQKAARNTVEKIRHSEDLKINLEKDRLVRLVITENLSSLKRIQKEIV